MFLGCTLLPKMESIWRIRTARANLSCGLGKDVAHRNARWVQSCVTCLLKGKHVPPVMTSRVQPGKYRRVGKGWMCGPFPAILFQTIYLIQESTNQPNSHVSPVHGCSWLRSWSNLCGRSLVDTWDLFSIS